MEIEELKKELEKLKDLKIYVFEGEVYVKVEDYREKTIENRKLKESLYIATKCSSKEENGIIRLSEENKKLKEKIDELEKYNLNLQERLDRKEEVNKKLREELSAYDREYFDEDKKANNIFIDKSGKVIKGGEFTTLC